MKTDAVKFNNIARIYYIKSGKQRWYAVMIIVDG